MQALSNGSMVCVACGHVGLPMLAPGTPPHEQKASCATCGRFLKWMPFPKPKEMPMASYNRLVLVGNLPRDPELRYGANGTAFTKFTVASSHKYKDKEDTVFLDVTVFGAQAEPVSTHLAQGSQVLVEGRITQESWEAQDGTRRTKHSMIADRVVFLSARTASATTASARSAPTAATRSASPAGPGDADDIPF